MVFHEDMAILVLTWSIDDNLKMFDLRFYSDTLIISLASLCIMILLKEVLVVSHFESSYFGYLELALFFAA